MRWSVLTSLGAACMLAVRVSAGPAELDDLRKVYAEQVSKLQETCDANLDNAAKSFLKVTEELEKQFLAAGDLKPLLAVREERARFAQNPDSAAMKPGTGTDRLGLLQKQYIETCKEIQLTNARAIVDLCQRYTRRLTDLQKDLTRQDRIEDALATLHEAESIQNSAEVSAAKAQIQAGGAAPRARRPPAVSTAADTQTLAKALGGEVVAWNPLTREITLSYAFKDEAPARDWEGGKLDPLRQALLCDRAVAWSKPSFSSVSSIACDAYYHEGTGTVRVAVGPNLVADVQPGEDGKAILHQGKMHFPVAASLGGVEMFRKYPISIAIDGDAVEWRLGKRSFARETLPQPVRYPARIGLGHPGSRTLYGNVVIKGVLSPESLKALAGGESP